jgi:hypothetical protein
MSHPDPLYDYHDDFYGEDWNDVMEDNMVEEDYYDDSMDGDHDSAMESAGWGTDEDYGYYGEDY